jgi:hypothetical protein
MLFARHVTTRLVFAALAAGCATGPGTTPRTDNGSSATVVTSQELTRLGQEGTLIDVLQRLRPSMLRSRGSTAPRVSVDGSPPADLSILEAITASAVREVRLERASSNVGRAAIAPNGHVIVGDLIVVATWMGLRGRR